MVLAGGALQTVQDRAKPASGDLRPLNITTSNGKLNASKPGVL